MIIKKCRTCGNDFSAARRNRGNYCCLSCARTKHGMARTKIYKLHQGMLDRCRDETNAGYENYGGRGITACDEWLSFENFYRDMGEPPEGMSLDRVDNNKGYSKENCRWATSLEQQNNTRATRLLTHNGKNLSISQWSKLLGVSRNRIRTRLAKGLSIEQALDMKKIKPIKQASKPQSP